MKTSQSHGAKSGGRQPPAEEDATRDAQEPQPQIPKRWRWHYRELMDLRQRLTEASGQHLAEATVPIERHSMHPADAATDQFDHDLVLSLLSAEQDALYEVEAAIKRITEDTYGICEQTGEPIPDDRLRAVPWTRFREEVEARHENAGDASRPHLGEVRSVRKTRGRPL